MASKLQQFYGIMRKTSVPKKWKFSKKNVINIFEKLGCPPKCSKKILKKIKKCTKKHQKWILIFFLSFGGVFPPQLGSGWCTHNRDFLFEGRWPRAAPGGYWREGVIANKNLSGTLGGIPRWHKSAQDWALWEQANTCEFWGFFFFLLHQPAQPPEKKTPAGQECALSRWLLGGGVASGHLPGAFFFRVSRPMQIFQFGPFLTLFLKIYRALPGQGIDWEGPSGKPKKLPI